MESHVFLIVAAVVLLNLVSTEAYKCYNCRYVSTLSSPWENASCTEPFYSANATTCEGNFCIAIWMNFTSLPGYVLQRTCTNDSSAVTIDRCEKLGTNSKKYFLSQNRCCLLTPNTTLPGDNRRFDQMSCGCQADNCNGNVPYPVMPTSSNSNMSPSLVGCQCQLIVSVMLLCTAFALKFLEILF